MTIRRVYLRHMHRGVALYIFLICRQDSIICRHDSFTRVTWLIHRVYLRHVHQEVALYVCVDVTHSYADMTQSYWLIHMKTWPTHTCDETHSFVDMTLSFAWYVAFICKTWLIYLRDMTQLYDSIICRYAVVTHSHVWHDSFMCRRELLICVTWLIRV